MSRRSRSGPEVPPADPQSALFRTLFDELRGFASGQTGAAPDADALLVSMAERTRAPVCSRQVTPDGGLMIRAHIPGVDEDDLVVSIVDGAVHLEATTPSGRYAASIALDAPVDGRTARVHIESGRVDVRFDPVRALA